VRFHKVYFADLFHIILGVLCSRNFFNQAQTPGKRKIDFGKKEKTVVKGRAKERNSCRHQISCYKETHWACQQSFTTWGTPLDFSRYFFPPSPGTEKVKEKRERRCQQLHSKIRFRMMVRMSTSQSRITWLILILGIGQTDGRLV